MSRKTKRYGSKKMTIACAVLVVVIIITTVISAVSAMGEYTPTSVDHIEDKILTNARAKLANMDSYLFYIEGYRNEHSADDNSEPLYFAYQIAGSKSKSDRSYSYMSSSDAYDNEYWYYDEDNEQYVDYVFSEDVGSWVRCELDYEPITVDPFNVLEDMSEFSLLEGTQQFGVNKEDCYVYQLVGTSDEFEVVYERIYIGVSDYLLKGAIRMAMHSLEEEIETTIDELTVKELYAEKGVEIDDDNLAEITVTTNDAEEVIFRFEYYFSNADMLFFDKPDIYMTAEEYATQMGLEAEEE